MKKGFAMQETNAVKNLNKDTIISFLRTNKSRLETEFGVTKIALFGSYARGDVSVDSDVDLVIDTKDLSFKTRCRLKRFLEANLNKPVDLCYFKGMRSFIRHAIEKELVYA
jgi:uncharacterized protein